MGDKIESHDQSGGITAKEVNIGTQTNTSNPEPINEKKNKGKKIIAVIITIILIVAAFVKILDYFNINPE